MLKETIEELYHLHTGFSAALGYYNLTILQYYRSSDPSLGISTNVRSSAYLMQILFTLLFLYFSEQFLLYLSFFFVRDCLL